VTHPGATLGVGTTPSKNFTIVSNHAIRGGIHTKYVGVWCYLTSHQESWKLTEAQVARDLGVGRDFVRSALANIEQTGCLIRTQERAEGSNGVFGKSAWFVTSLPFILRDAGITDEDLISERVKAEHEQWLTDNGFKSNVRPQKPHHRRSEPMSGYPMSGNHTTKKTISKKTNTKETNKDFLVDAERIDPEPDPPKPDLNNGREDADRLCEHLADWIERNGSRRPGITKRWRDAARLLLDVDGRTEEQVHRAIDWCQQDEFWRGNILSMPKLREKYDQLPLKAQQQSNPSSKRPTSDDKVRGLLEMAGMDLDSFLGNPTRIDPPPDQGTVGGAAAEIEQARKQITSGDFQ